MAEEISIKQNGASEQQRQFISYLNDQLKWLQHYYKKQGVSSKDKLSQIKTLFIQLKQKLGKCNNGNYFADFNQLKENKTLRKQIFLNHKQNIFEIQEENQQITQELKKYNSKRQAFQKKTLFQNHITVIEFLTNNRFCFKNIARHIYRGKLKNVKEFDEGFEFDVQRGIDSSVWNKDHSIGLLYVLVRDLSKAIIELQKYQIFHLDIKIRNIILLVKKQWEINQLNLILNNPKKLAKIIKTMTFKLIDFGNSILLANQFMQKTKIILDLPKCEILGSLLLADNQHGEWELRQIAKKGSKSDIFKVKHSQSFTLYFKSLFNNIKNPAQINLLTQFQPNGRYYKMIEDRNYEDLIKQMEKLIQKFIKDHEGQK